MEARAGPMAAQVGGRSRRRHAGGERLVGDERGPEGSRSYSAVDRGHVARTIRAGTLANRYRPPVPIAETKPSARRMDYSFTPPRGARGGGGGAGHRPRSGGSRRRQARDPYDAGVHQVSSAVELGSGGAGYGDSIGGRSDDDWLLEEAMLGGGGGRGAGRLGAHGSAEEALLPDSLTDPAGSSDWKDEMDPAAREQYRQLGKATQRPPLSRCCKLKQPLVWQGWCCTRRRRRSRWQLRWSRCSSSSDSTGPPPQHAARPRKIAPMTLTRLSARWQ